MNFRFWPRTFGKLRHRSLGELKVPDAFSSWLDGSLAVRFDVGITLLAFGVFLVGLLWGVVVLKVRDERDAAIASLNTRTANLARAFEEHTRRTINEADQTLLFIRHQYHEHGAQLDLRGMVEDGLIISRIYNYLGIIDEHGDLTASSRAFQPMNLADREYFQVHAARDILHQPFIGQPVVGRVSGKTSIHLSRRIEKRDLSFGGVTVASIDPAYFSDFYGNLDLGKRGLILLVGRDGIVRARRSGDDTTIGQDLGNTELFKQLQVREHGGFRTRGSIEGVHRVASYRALAEYPLVIVVGVAEDEALAGFNQRVRDYYRGATLVSLVILVLTVFLVALTARQKKLACELQRQNMVLAHAEQATRESEHKLRAIVDNDPECVKLVARDGTLLQVNPAGLAMLGADGADAVVGKPIYALAAPQYRDALRALTEDVFRGNSGTLEFDLVTLHGHTRQMETHAAPLHSPHNGVDSMLAVTRDVTERRQAEVDRARLAAIVESSDDAIVSRALDGTVTSWNAGAERMFGYAAGKAIGSPITLLMQQGLPSRLAQNTNTVLSGETVVPFESQRTTKNGRVIDVLVSVSPLRDTAGQITGASAIFHDISASKQAEADRAWLAAIVASSDDAIISRSADGTILTWNAAAERMFGWTAQEAVGQPITIIIPLDRRGELRPLIERVTSGETIGAIESMHLRKDGTRVDTSVTFSALRNAARGVAGISLIYRDITVQKRLEREARRKAELTQLMESLARAANEATGAEEAMRRCLELILDHGRWTVGAVGVFGSAHAGVPRSVLWHTREPARFDTFMERSNATDHTATRGHFVGKVLREKRPVWIADVSQTGAAGRIGYAASIGLRSAFAFPVIVRGEVAAFLEFFSEEPREPDQLMLEAIGTIGAQLARLIERGRATDELHQREHQLRLVTDNVPAMIAYFDKDLCCRFSNRSYSELYRVAPGRIIGMTLPEIVGADSYNNDLKATFPPVMEGQTVVLRREHRTESGEVRHIEIHRVPDMSPEGGFRGYYAMLLDITERKQAQEQIAYLSQYDALTGLPNRNLFRDRLELALARAKRHQRTVGILLLDLDRFKDVNESFGQEAGDEMLRAIAARLKDTLRDVDTIARLGGDEFAILVEDVPGAEDVTAVAEKLLAALTEPFMIRDNEVFSTPSIGITVHPNGTDDPHLLVAHAQTAMSRVKHDGGGSYQHYVQQTGARHSQRLALESRLRRAQANGEFTLHYQPKVSLKTGRITGAEALLRWENPQLGPVSPAQFIPLAEENGLIVPIGEWALRAACAQAQTWREQGHEISVAVNLSARQFRQKDLVGRVAAALVDSGLPGERLELEITESTAMTSPEQAITALSDLRKLGIRLAVDDFGTGYSSLSYLKRLPLDSLKIDRSFVRDVGGDANSDAIVRATVALAHSLNLKVVAEGVETEAQRGFLSSAGCDEMQGYLYSRPLPAAAFGRLLTEPG